MDQLRERKKKEDKKNRTRITQMTLIIADSIRANPFTPWNNILPFVINLIINLFHGVNPCHPRSIAR